MILGTSACAGALPDVKKARAMSALYEMGLAEAPKPVYCLGCFCTAAIISGALGFPWQAHPPAPHQEKPL